MNASFSHRSQEPESGVLYLVGTPIGNLNDISSRAINILKNVSLIACEDTRQTKKLASRFDINNRFMSFNKHNSLSRIPKFINFLKEGKSIALVSDAGMPCICDPGEDIAKSIKSEAKDDEWKMFPAKLILQTKTDVLPIYFDGKNGLLFHLFAKIYLQFHRHQKMV